MKKWIWTLTALLVVITAGWVWSVPPIPSPVPSPLNQSGKIPVSNGTIYQMQSLSDFGGGDTVAPATNHSGYVPSWNGADSKTLADGYLVDTDLSSVSGSDDTLASAKAIKAALDGKQAASSNLTTAAGASGNSKYYGSNSGGTVGIYDLPSGTFSG